MNRLLLVLFFLTNSQINCFAYVGPGLGLGAIGAILGIIFSILLVILAFLWYPLKRFLSKNKDLEEIDNDDE